MGQSAIVLVPEIAFDALSLSLCFERRIGQDIAVYHSTLSPGERYDEWKAHGAGQRKSGDRRKVCRFSRRLPI